MISDMERNNIIAKIEKDEPVLESIQSLIEDYGIYSGLIVFGIGMLRDLEIGYWNGKEYEKEVIKEAGELVSLHGSITSNEPYVHAHVAVATSDHIVKGGHFFNAVADPLVELHVIRLEEVVLKRKLNQKTGLNELNFD